MYRILTLFLPFLLLSCGGGSSSDSDDDFTGDVRDLSGTWLYRTKTDSYFINNGAFYISQNLDRIMIIDDSEDSSIQIFECIDYPSSPIQATDLDGNLQVTMPGGITHNYTKISDDDYEYKDPVRRREQNLPLYEFEDTYRLKKLSDSIEIDYGMFSVKGNNNSLDVTEDAQVCTQHFFIEGVRTNLTLQVPFDNTSIEFGLDFQNQPNVGTYFHSGALSQPFNFFWIVSDSSLFDQIVGGRIDTVVSEINITTSDDQVFAGDFSIDNGSGVEYTGEFYIQKLPDIP